MVVVMAMATIIPGNEKPLRRAGVNYDDWPIDVYKSTPYFTLDPAATHGRRMAQVRSETTHRDADST